MTKEPDETTPRPWRIEPYEDLHGEIQCEIVSSANSRIVIRRVPEPPDAQLIVEAVNAYDQLKEKIETLRNEVQFLNKKIADSEETSERYRNTLLAIKSNKSCSQCSWMAEAALSETTAEKL